MDRTAASCMGRSGPMPAGGGPWCTREGEVLWGGGLGRPPSGEGMLVILFQVFVLYALVAANTLAVSTACGSSFWNFMFSRFLLVFIELIIMGVGRAVWHKKVEDDPIYHSMKQVCFLLVLRIIYISLGAVYVKDAMDNGGCTSALSHASFTNTPLLGILGYFYLVLDSLSAMLSLCACCSMMVIFGSDASNVSL